MRDDQETIKISLLKSTLPAETTTSNGKPEPRGVANPVDFTEDTITEQMETPAEDMESQDGNIKRTSFGTHATVTTSDKREQLASKAQEVLSRIEELKKQVIEGEDTTAPCCSGNCEDKAGQLLKLSLPADLEEKTADLKQDRSNARRSDMNQCRNATMDDMADLEESPYDKELPCSCGQ